MHRNPPAVRPNIVAKIIKYTKKPDRNLKQKNIIKVITKHSMKNLR